MKHFKRQLIIIGLLASVLTAATVVGSRLLKDQGFGTHDQTIIASNSGDIAFAQVTYLDTIPSAKMPDSEPDVAGLFVNREDNRVFIGTGMVSAVRSADGQWKTQHDGPLMEVIVTRDTEIYRNDTLVALNGEAPAGQVRQLLEATSLEDVAGVNTSMEAWGVRRGDRLLATVLIFTPFS